MNGFIPKGYIPVRNALNRLGGELFPSEWTGEERKARRGLISKDDWLKTKDLPPLRWQWCARQRGDGWKGRSRASYGHAASHRASLPTLSTRPSTGPIGDTRMHVIGFVPCLRVAI
jgi:hypothetical protein